MTGGAAGRAVATESRKERSVGAGRGTLPERVAGSGWSRRMTPAAGWDVALVAADGELVGDGLALVGELTPHRGRSDGEGVEGGLVAGGGEGLGGLAAVAVDGHGLEGELPGFVVGLLDLLDRGAGG